MVSLVKGTASLSVTSPTPFGISGYVVNCRHETGIEPALPVKGASPPLLGQGKPSHEEVNDPLMKN